MAITILVYSISSQMNRIVCKYVASKNTECKFHITIISACEKTIGFTLAILS